MKNRVKYMDIAKGIGMICVLMGHTFNYNQVWTIVNTFHMPLFFLISGFFFSPDEKSFIGKKSGKLLIPYGITIIAFTIFSCLNGRWRDALIWIGGGVYGSGYDYETPFLIKGVGGIWFLLALFWVKIIANEILKIDEKFQMWVAVLVTYAGVKTYSCFVFPWSIQNGMTACLFFVLGYHFRKEKMFEHLHPAHIIFMLIVWFYCYKYYGTLTMVNCNIPNIMTVIGALCGSIIIIYFSKIIEKQTIIANVLEYIGQLTLIILCVHIFELHTGILINIQSALYEKANINIHIFVLRCIWSVGVAIVIKKCISAIQHKRSLPNKC